MDHNVSNLLSCYKYKQYYLHYAQGHIPQLVENHLVQHRKPTEMRTVPHASIGMRRPQRQRQFIETQHLDGEQILVQNDTFNSTIAPISRETFVLDFLTLQFHFRGVLHAGPVAIGRGKMLGRGFAPKNLDHVVRVLDDGVV